ncbi:MAG: hypothetical protein AAB368_16240 [bacterium]
MEGFPSSIARRMLERGKASKVLAVVIKNGRPSRVYDLQAYLRRVEQTKRLKPSRFRKTATAPDPLGAVHGKIKTSLSRRLMYD